MFITKMISLFDCYDPLGNYKFKSNQPSGVEVKQLPEMAKSCGSNPGGFSTYSFRSSTVQLYSSNYTKFIVF